MTVTVPPQGTTGRDPRRIAIWVAVAVAGAAAWGVIALVRGEQISAIWLIVAALASYAIAYRFYARFIVTRVLEVDDTRATPAERVSTARPAAKPAVPWRPRSVAANAATDNRRKSDSL